VQVAGWCASREGANSREVSKQRGRKQQCKCVRVREVGRPHRCGNIGCMSSCVDFSLTTGSNWRKALGGPGAGEEKQLPKTEEKQLPKTEEGQPILHGMVVPQHHERKWKAAHASTDRASTIDLNGKGRKVHSCVPTKYQDMQLRTHPLPQVRLT